MGLLHKYRAKTTTVDNIKFQSKLEAAYYTHLKIKQRLSEIVFFLQQVPFILPGNVKYLADFQVFNSDGSVDFIDVKGVDTYPSKIKRKMVEELYRPVKIKIVKKGEF